MGKSILDIILFGFAAIVAIILLIILMLIIYSDYCKTKEFNRANRIKARVVKKVGIHECANYGRHYTVHGMRQVNTKYFAYQVEYFIDGASHSGIHLEKKDDYNIGNTVEIRYVWDENGGYRIVNRDIKDRFYRLLFSACLATPLIVVAIILKHMGYI